MKTVDISKDIGSNGFQEKGSHFLIGGTFCPLFKSFRHWWIFVHCYLKRLTLNSHFQTDLTIIFLSSLWSLIPYLLASLPSSSSLPSYRILFEVTFSPVKNFFSLFLPNRKGKMKKFFNVTYFHLKFLVFKQAPKILYSLQCQCQK